MLSWNGKEVNSFIILPLFNSSRFSYTKRFRALRRCVSEGAHRSEFNGAEDEIEEENFQPVSSY